MNDEPIVALSSEDVRDASLSDYGVTCGRGGGDRFEPDDVGHVGASTRSENLKVVVATVAVLAGGEVEARTDLGPAEVAAAEGAEDRDVLGVRPEGLVRLCIPEGEGVQCRRESLVD